MKDFLKYQVGLKDDILQKRSLVREYLQARILQMLQDKGVFLNWAFLGGTALRFLYNLPRYSEDLDFSLVDSSKDCEFEKVLGGIRRAFNSEDYRVDITTPKKKTVMSAFIKFPGIFFEMGCSSRMEEVLSIKIEVDTNPPEGAETETTIVRRFVTVNVNHYSRSSLLAGKLHAVLTRQYTKGRDLYDLIWYLSDRLWPDPNLILLNNALIQTEWNGPVFNERNWRQLLAERMSDLQWKQVQVDLAPFLERQDDLSLISYENCMKLLEREI
ncbi:MAG: nucleotidyl transferase AbiEii/AbiGii toxin family protein [Bacteroidales bacterium]|nr:nucleotidyl transferase AbiEii/AbiGii toxin family protein [Bacteroidales bacterium]